MPLFAPRNRRQLGRFGTGWLLAAVALAAVLPLRAQSSHIRPAAPGLNEAGTPYFEITSPVTLGLSAPPTDLQPLPDGRILALSDREVALGDGTRWEIHRLDPADSAARSTQVAIAADGAIYNGIPSGIARLDFQADGSLRRTIVAHNARSADDALHRRQGRDRWYWHGGLGAVIRWKPGEPPVPTGRISDLERAILLGSDVYLSDRSDGSFGGRPPTGLEPLIARRDTNVSNSVTCGIDLGGGDYVVGTNATGSSISTKAGLPRSAPAARSPA
jgi:hypothetical protein